MTDEQLTQFWQTAITPLQDQFQSAVFRAVFKTSSIERLTDEEIVILVDNKQLATFIRRFAEPQILTSIITESGINPKTVTYKQRTNPREGKISQKTIEKGLEPQMFSNTSQSTGEVHLDPHLEANLNPKYTFDTFIVGNKNRLAFAAAQAVADNPGNLYNPLFIYGGVGLGKTHLMQAIGNAVLQIDPKKKVLYVACEHFLNEFVSAIKKSSTEQFKKKYRSIDIFFVDDIQFIAGRDGVQEEFFHTFNALHQGNKQIVMTSDRRPSDIKGLEDRLTSRFNMGMVTDVQIPDRETRHAILQAKCQERGVNLPGSVLSYIAEHVDTSIRELEGALNKVIGDLMLRNEPATVETVRQSLSTVISQQTAARRSPSSLLAELVANHYQVTVEDLLGSCRTRDLVHPRHILMYLLKHEVGMTYPLIGKVIGGRDHTTIMHGVEKITTELKKDSTLLSDLQSIKNSFYEYKQ